MPSMPEIIVCPVCNYPCRNEQQIGCDVCRIGDIWMNDEYRKALNEQRLELLKAKRGMS